MLRHRRDAERFADAVDGRAACDALPSHVATAARTAHRLTERADELAPQLPEQFRAALRQRLLAVSAVQPDTAPAAPPVPLTARRRAVISVATVTAGVVVATGIVVGGGVAASSDSLPGEPLYAVKRATESVQLRTASGLLARGNKHLELATTRATEIEKLVQEGSLNGGAKLSGPVDTQVAATLADMDGDVTSGSDMLTQAATEEKNREPLDTLIRWTSDRQSALTQLLPLLSPLTKRQAEASMTLLSGVQARAKRVLQEEFGQTGSPVRDDPRPASPGQPVSPAPRPPSQPVIPDPVRPPDPVRRPVAPVPGPVLPAPRPPVVAPPPARPEPAPTPAPPPPTPAAPSPIPVEPPPTTDPGPPPGDPGGAGSPEDPIPGKVVPTTGAGDPDGGPAPDGAGLGGSVTADDTADQSAGVPLQTVRSSDPAAASDDDGAAGAAAPDAPTG